MGRIVINKSETVNISESARLQQATFTQQIMPKTIGPVQAAPEKGGDAVAATNSQVVIVNKWKAMTTGDQGLKNAIYEFINTTKEGVKVTPDISRGREKKLVFNFYGSMGKSIKPGEIGEFEVIFSYPPTAGNTTHKETEGPGPGQQ